MAILTTENRLRVAGLIAALAFTLAAACSSDSDGGSPAHEPVDDTSGGFEWQTSTPEEQGMDSAVLEGTREYMFQDGMNTQAVIVVRHGVIVAEWYAQDADETSYGTSWSMAKSFVSVLVGIALKQGLIESVDVPMTEFVPEWSGTDKDTITLRHALGMSTGLDWVESYNPFDGGESDVVNMLYSSDQLSYAINQEPVHEPGTVWYYSSGTTMLLSRVIEGATGRTALEYANENIFGPLGMESAQWWQDGAGHTLTYCCLDAVARDFARFGLMLIDGTWEGAEIVTPEWLGEASSPSQTDYAGYGYQFWLNHPDADDFEPDLPDDLFAALGHDVQTIYMMPSLDIVVVRNGTYVKPEGDPVAPDGLFDAGLTSDGLGPTGSKPPDIEWSEVDFLRPVVQAVVD